ncbi:MAG TPA: hypothetical protein VEK11_22885 [Thermoanaerobaculia bacterium]|nr:hypothetical protein [Thermoanaerobaculia bacterium]
MSTSEASCRLARTRPRHASIALIGLLAIGLFAPACVSKEVKRTRLERWRAKHLPDYGIRVEAPADAFTSFGLQMHHRSNGIADATWFITIGIERKTRAEFDTPNWPSPENPVSADPEYMRWLQWLTAFHPETSIYESTSDSRQYRRDVVLPSGEITSLHATYVHWPFSPEERAADDAVIRRILASAR